MYPSISRGASAASSSASASVYASGFSQKIASPRRAAAAASSPWEPGVRIATASRSADASNASASANRRGRSTPKRSPSVAHVEAERSQTAAMRKSSGCFARSGRWTDCATAPRPRTPTRNGAAGRSTRWSTSLPASVGASLPTSCERLHYEACEVKADYDLARSLPVGQHLRFGTAAVAVLAAITLPATLAQAGSRSTGTSPPEWATNAGSWPSHNLDLANTRANLHTRIDARDVSKLKKRWIFRLPYVGGYGAFTSNPIVLGGVVYFEDPDSDVFALRLATGKLLWKHDYRSVTPSGGPNGVAFGYGLLYGETENSVFALDPHTGKQVWLRKLTAKANEGIDMAPQLYDGKLLISTIPGSSTSFYTGGAYGIVYALDARTGKELWSFSTVKGGAKLWGDPKENGGGGLWYPPAVDAHGRVFIGTGNPSPYPLTTSDPNARSRPGPNLYTDSLVALDGATGKLLWYQQVTPHDLRDYDFQDSPIARHGQGPRRPDRGRDRRRQVRAW